VSETIQQLLAERASWNTAAVKYGEECWTWREHVRDASARAAALLALMDPNRRCMSVYCWETPPNS
jgi:fatty-acyl-CoA synthase